MRQAIDTVTGYMYGGERTVEHARQLALPLRELTDVEWEHLVVLSPWERVQTLAQLAAPQPEWSPKATPPHRTAAELAYDRIEESRRLLAFPSATQ